MMGNVIGYLSGEPAWIWMIVAAVLFVLDVLMPGFYLVWFGVAASAVGVLLFAVPLDPDWQVLAFCAASLISLLAGRMLWGGDRGGMSDKPLLNKRASQLIGRTFVLATPIAAGRGRVTAGDGLWSVRGPDLPAGAIVRVTAADGTELIVEAAE
jgi:inner membrane protein